jgi:uncharacterized protein (TIGR01244 family)
MDNIVYITSQFAVTAALAPEDFATAAARGFRSVISNRPDNEDHGQLTARAESVLAWRSGLAFRHVPAAKTDIFGDAVVEAMEEAIRTLGSRVGSLQDWRALGRRLGCCQCPLPAGGLRAGRRAQSRLRSRSAARRVGGAGQS